MLSIELCCFLVLLVQLAALNLLSLNCFLAPNPLLSSGAALKLSLMPPLSSLPLSDNVTLTALQWNQLKCFSSVLQLWTQTGIYTPPAALTKRHETLQGGEAVNGLLKMMKTLLVCLSLLLSGRETHGPGDCSSFISLQSSAAASADCSTCARMEKQTTTNLLCTVMVLETLFIKCRWNFEQQKLVKDFPL